MVVDRGLQCGKGMGQKYEGEDGVEVVGEGFVL